MAISCRHGVPNSTWNENGGLTWILEENSQNETLLVSVDAPEVKWELVDAPEVFFREADRRMLHRLKFILGIIE